jgi:hypothetical protein
MKRTKHSQTSPGFSAVTLILALVIILGIGGVGWYVWHSRQTKPTTNTPSSNNTPNEETPVADQSEGGKYIVIKEWGIRIPLSEELQSDVKYGVFTFSNGDQTIYFASKKITAHSPGGACDLVPQSDSAGQGISGGTIAVSRSKVKPEVVDQRSFYEDTGYWYTLDFSNGGACYEGDTGQEKGAFNIMMDEAIKKLESTY